MANASNYSDTTDTDFTAENYSIAEGKKLSAAGMRAALHTKEKVANKQICSTAANDAADTLTAATSSDSYYPTAKLVGKNLDALKTTVQAVNTALGGKEDAGNKVTTISAANKDDATKYPTIGAVTAWASAAFATTALLDALLPIGTIIAMGSKAYYNTADASFKNKWKICDNTNGTPDLRNLFLRGMPDGGTDAVGSDSVTLSASNLPAHTHQFTGTEQTGAFGEIATDINNSNSSVFTHAVGCFSGSIYVEPNNTNIVDADGRGATGYKCVDFSMIPSGSVTGGGGSPQTGVSIVPKYFAVIYVMKIA